MLPKAYDSGVESCPLLGSRQTSPRYDAHNSRLLDQRKEVKHVEEGGTWHRETRATTSTLLAQDFGVSERN